MRSRQAGMFSWWTKMSGRAGTMNTVISQPAVRPRARAVNVAAELELVCQSFEVLTERLQKVERWIHACGEGKIALPPDAGHEARLALLEAKTGVVNPR